MFQYSLDDCPWRHLQIFIPGTGHAGPQFLQPAAVLHTREPHRGQEVEVGNRAIVRLQIEVDAGEQVAMGVVKAY